MTLNFKNGQFAKAFQLLAMVPYSISFESRSAEIRIHELVFLELVRKQRRKDHSSLFKVMIVASRRSFSVSIPKNFAFREMKNKCIERTCATKRRLRTVVTLDCLEYCRRRRLPTDVQTCIGSPAFSLLSEICFWTRYGPVWDFEVSVAGSPKPQGDDGFSNRRQSEIRAPEKLPFAIPIYCTDVQVYECLRIVVGNDKQDSVLLACHPSSRRVHAFGLLSSSSDSLDRVFGGIARLVRK